MSKALEDVLVEIPAFPWRKLHGKVSFVSPALESSSKIVRIRVEIPNAGGDYQPGMQAWLTPKGKFRNIIGVPNNALIQGKDGTTVWMKDADGAFESRMVMTGTMTRDFTEIKEGLRAGELVVISGAYLLNSELVFKNGADPMAGHHLEGSGEHKGH